jgi:hypothetical protein
MHEPVDSKESAGFFMPTVPRQTAAVGQTGVVVTRGTPLSCATSGWDIFDYSPGIFI